MEPCIIRYSILKNGVLFSISAFMFLVSLLMLTTHYQPMSALALIGITLCGLGAFLFGYRTLNRQPLLIICENGITHHKDWIGFIPWSDIKSFKLHRYPRFSILHIYVKNPEKWQSRWPRILYSPERKSITSRGIVEIPFSGIDTPASTIHNVIEKYTSVK